MGFDFLQVIDEDVSSIGNLVVLDLTLPVVENGDTCVPVHNDDGAFLIDHGFKIITELDDSIILGFQLGSFGSAHSDSSHMEGPHGELCSRLADGLGCRYAHSLAELNLRSGCHIASIAELAYTPLRFTRQDRADLDPFDTQLLQQLSDIFGDLFVDIDDHVIRIRVEQFFQ